jgi:hypothetical protein
MLVPKPLLRRPKPRGRPRKTLTVEEFLHRYRDTPLTWCDENGNPTPDQSAGYIRPLTAAEKQAAAIAEINETLSSNPEFERCTSDGTPDPNGDHWKLREPVSGRPAPSWFLEG